MQIQCLTVVFTQLLNIFYLNSHHTFISGQEICTINNFVKTLKTNPYVGKKKTIKQLCPVYLVILGQSKCSETPAYWDSDKPKIPLVNGLSVTFNLNNCFMLKLQVKGFMI